jgi:hypothetical protein
MIDVAMMAVTAPNYVLEESLSSQMLWKETAGARPPQPYEERAFYEKMWAQNFARSKVEYHMPVEILTASTSDMHGGSSSSNDNYHDYNHHHHYDGHHPHHETGATDYTNMSVDGSTHPHHAYRNNNNHNPNHHHHQGGDGDTHRSSGPIGTGVSGLGNPGNHHNADAQADYLSRRIQYQEPRYDQHQDYSVVTTNSSGIGGAGASTSTPTETFYFGKKKVQGDLTVIIRGDNVYGTTVSKSFARSTSANGLPVSVDTVNISIASYRVVEKHRQGKFAQFLVIYREGSVRDTVGVWKRYRDFEELASKVNQTNNSKCSTVMANISPLHVTEETDIEDLPNAKTSWRLLKKRQRWFRCLDAGYLSLKVFLLERFLHDILFESSTPKLLRDFVGADPTFRNYQHNHPHHPMKDNTYYQPPPTMASTSNLSYQSSYGLYSTPEF